MRSIQVTSALPNPKPPLPRLLWNCVIVMGVGMYSAFPILIHLCEENGEIPFSSGALNFCIELMKLILSLSIFFCTERRDNTGAQPSCAICFSKLNARTILSFSFPAVLYCINNNLGVYIQLEMDPATYQILCNMKILTTAVLFRIIMKKPIPTLHSIALGLLLVSGITNSVGGLFANRDSVKLQNADTTLHITWLGVVLITIYCFQSGLAGVYTEYVLKKEKEVNLHLQNTLLYVFGVGLNAFTFAAQTGFSSSGLQRPFQGFSIYAWLVVVFQALLGILMSAVMKYATNITRIFVIGSSVIVTTMTSLILFGLQLNRWFVCSFILVFISLAMYHTPHSQAHHCSVRALGKFNHWMKYVFAYHVVSMIYERIKNSFH